MKRILHVISSLGPGGASRAAIAIAKYSSRLETIRHSIVSLQDPTPEAVDLAGEAGMNFIRSSDPKDIRYEIEKADIVHLHWWNCPKVMEWMLSDLPEMRMLVWFHIAGDSSPQVITDEVVEYADMALASSPQSYRCGAFSRLPEQVRREKTDMVYDAADFHRLQGFSPKSHTGFNVGYIGTVDFIKMHPDYVKMSAAVDIPGVNFIVCGMGHTDVIEQQAQQLGAAQRFDVRGYVPDIIPVLEILDVYGYPLCEETYASGELNLQEVMLAGVPPVVFPYGGIKDLVQHEETGLVVNSSTEYKEAIEYLHHNPEVRAQLGQNAMKYAQRVFGAENAAHKLNPIYERMMQQPKRKRILSGSFVQHNGLTAEESGAQGGAELFIQSLADATTSSIFDTSLNGSDPEEVIASDEKIVAASHVLVHNGLRPYSSYFEKDGALHFWNGLAFYGNGEYDEAVQEFAQAIAHGCRHWRVKMFLALASLKGEGTAAQPLQTTGGSDSKSAQWLHELQRQAQGFHHDSTPGSEQPDLNGKQVAGQEKEQAQTDSSPVVAPESIPDQAPLVTAIVSAYNSERHMRGCLDDLTAQTISDRLEIVVVDSGSPQNEAEIVREYQQKHPNIKYIRTDERESVYAAWNRAIQVARGQFITNANTDDRHRRDAYEQMVDVLNQRPAVALAYANVYITKTDNETFEQHTRTGMFRWHDFDRAKLLEGCFMGPQPMWRRSLHEQYGYFDDSLESAGDWEFWLRIAETETFFHIDEFLGLYLESPSGIEHRDLQLSAKEGKAIQQKYRRRRARKLDDLLQSSRDHIDSGHLLEGLTTLSQLLYLEPEHFAGLCLVGDVCLQQGNLLEAETVWKQALALKPDNSELLEKIAKLSPNAKSDLSDRLGLARSMIRSGKLLRGLEVLSSVLETSPQNREALALMADVYNRLGKHDDAQQVLQLAEFAH